MPLKFHVPIGPDSPTSYSNFAQYLQRDSRPFSAGHPLLETSIVSPTDVAVPDDYLTVKAPFTGTLSRDATHSGYVIIELDQIKYTEQLAENSIPILPRITHAYMGPVELFESVATALSQSPYEYLKVEAGQALGKISSSKCNLGFYISTYLDQHWVSPVSVIHHLLDPNHPLVKNVANAQTIDLTGDGRSENERLLIPVPSTDYYLLTIEKDGFLCRIFSYQGANPTTDIFTFSSGDQYTFLKVNPLGEVVPSAPGDKITLSLKRRVFGLEGADEYFSQNEEVDPGATVRMRDVFGPGIFDDSTFNKKKARPYLKYRLKAWIPGEDVTDFPGIEFMQDDTEMLREEYLDKSLPVPPRHWFTVPQRKSLNFDVRNLFLQHDYSSLKKSDDFWADTTRLSDITICQQEVRQAAEFVQACYSHYVLDSAVSEFSEDERNSISTRLTVTRGFVNPELNDRLHYPALHSQQYGRSIEFKPFVSRGSYRERLIRALGKACVDFLRELKLANNTSQEFSYRFLNFAKFGKQLWSIRYEDGNTPIAGKPIKINDDGGIDIQGTSAKVGNYTISSTLRAEKKAHRMSIAWQIPNVLSKIQMPTVPVGPITQPIDEDGIQKTNLVLLATEFSNLPLENQLALDDKAESLRAWFQKKYPDDNTFIQETKSLVDVYEALGMFDAKPLRIRNMALVSHAGPNHVMVRSFVVPHDYTDPINSEPEGDAEFMTHYEENLERLKELYPPGVKFYPETVTPTQYGIRPYRWSITSLVKLSNASKNRLKQVFAGAHSIILTGCNTDYENFVDSSTFSGVLSRLTNTDVFGATFSTVSVALRNDGKWQWHGLPGTGSVGDHRGTPFVPGTNPEDLRSPLTVISVYKDHRTEFVEDPDNYVASDQEFDVLGHYTSYLGRRFAPVRRSD